MHYISIHGCGLITETNFLYWNHPVLMSLILLTLFIICGLNSQYFSVNNHSYYRSFLIGLFFYFSYAYMAENELITLTKTIYVLIIFISIIAFSSLIVMYRTFTWVMLILNFNMIMTVVIEYSIKIIF